MTEEHDAAVNEAINIIGDAGKELAMHDGTAVSAPNFLLRSFTVILDNTTWENVIFHDCRFHWDGDPFKLTNCRLAGTVTFCVPAGLELPLIRLLKDGGFVGAVTILASQTVEIGKGN